MSLVNIVLIASTWCASEPMTAEMMPAPSSPASQAGAYVVQQAQQNAVGILEPGNHLRADDAEENARQPDQHDRDADK